MVSRNISREITCNLIYCIILTQHRQKQIYSPIQLFSYLIGVSRREGCLFKDIITINALFSMTMQTYHTNSTLVHLDYTNVHCSAYVFLYTKEKMIQNQCAFAHIIINLTKWPNTKFKYQEFSINIDSVQDYHIFDFMR